MKRLHTVVLVLIAISGFCQPALAESQWYISGFLGATQQNLNDNEWKLSGDTGDMKDVKGSSYLLGAAFGARAGNIARGELALTYRGGMDSKWVDPDIKLKVNSLTTIMANLWFDLPVEWAAVPYVGGGIGAVMMSYDLHVDAMPGFQSVSLDSENALGLAANLGLGFSYPISDRAKLDIGYRLVYMDDMETKKIRYAGIGDMKTSYNGFLHDLVLGIRYNF